MFVGVGCTNAIHAYGYEFNLEKVLNKKQVENAESIVVNINDNLKNTLWRTFEWLAILIYPKPLNWSTICAKIILENEKIEKFMLDDFDM